MLEHLCGAGQDRRREGYSNLGASIYDVRTEGGIKKYLNFADKQYIKYRQRGDSKNPKILWRSALAMKCLQSPGIWTLNAEREGGRDRGRKGGKSQDIS